MKTKLFILVAFVLASVFSITAQSWVEREQKVKDLFEQVKQTDDILKKNELANKIQVEMIEILMEVDSFEYDFPLLDNVGSVISSDNMIHMYSWNVVLEPDKMQFFTILQNKEFNTIHILAQGEPYIPSMAGAIPENKWYGALYYEIHPIEYRDKKMYMVFGLVPTTNGETQYKVIDVMAISKRQIKLGASMFQLIGSRKKQYRVMFEYDQLAQMTIEFDKRKKRVVYNHLVPIRTLESGKDIYAPDETFDALVYKKDLWTEQEDVRVKAKREKKPKAPKKSKKQDDSEQGVDDDTDTDTEESED